MGPLEVEEAVRLLAELAEGLSALHGGGLIHRDLKPGNIMITTHGHVKIMDLGLARSVDIDPEGDKASTTDIAVKRLFGTVSYMSPEQAMGQNAGPQSDLFSLGVLGYETLTGVKPFQGPSLFKVLSGTVSTRQISVRDLRPEAPEELSDLIDDLLEKKPEDRPGSASEVLVVLEKWTGSTSEVLRVASQKSSDPKPTTLGRDESRGLESQGPASVASVDISGSVILDRPFTLGSAWDDLLESLRLSWYRLRPSAAYHRHAELVDQSFQAPLQAKEERELTHLEAYLDRLEAPQWEATRGDLIRLRDELKAQKAGD